MLLKPVSLIGLSMFILACNPEKKDVSVQSDNRATQSSVPTAVDNTMIKETKTADKSPYQAIHVTVIYLPLEGGFFGMTTDSGEKLNPINLAKEYQLDGTKLVISGELLTDRATIEQWGQPFSISQVKLIKMGKPIDFD